MIAAIVKCIQRIALAAFDRTIAFGLIAASLPEKGTKWWLGNL